uniref:Uncharacterized protein n=1 Tax=Astatotilapia calliptera TaxID=8154 RepID=A0A3P8PN52_ASTCA
HTGPEGLTLRQHVSSQDLHVFYRSISVELNLVILPVFLLGSAALCRRSEMGSWRPSSSMIETVTVEDWIGSPSSLISIRTRLVLTSPVYRLTVKREIQALWPESASTAVTLVTR